MTLRIPGSALFLLMVCSWALLLSPAAVFAQMAGNPLQTQDLEGVTLTRKVGDSVPLDLEFRDHQNRTRRLASLFEENGPPVILVPLYFDCPIVCPKTLNDTGNALRGIRDWLPGREYRLLILSFDHRDTPRRSSIERETFLLKFEQDPLDKGIEFWTGDSQNILALTNAVGFGYRFMPASGHFSHTSAMIFLRNDGTIHNYLPGTDYTSAQVRMSVTEATDNRRPTIWEQVALLCRVMDESTGEYVISPMRVMQLVGGLTVVVVFGGIAALVITNRIREKPAFA